MKTNITPVILSFNHPEITSRCVKSVLNHFPQCILIHNGSIKKHQERLQTEFPEINHVIIPQNKGFTGGVNIALNESFKISPWALFITNDCELDLIDFDFLKCLHKPMFIAPLIYSRKKPKIDSIGGHLNFRKIQLSHVKNVETKLSDLFIDKISNISPFFKSKSALQTTYIPGTAFLIHKDYYSKVGTFDESLHTYWEDVDYSLRAHSIGETLHATNAIQFVHKIGKTCHKDPFYTNFLFRRNQKIVIRKWAPARLRPKIEFEFLKLELKKLTRQIYYFIKSTQE